MRVEAELVLRFRPRPGTCTTDALLRVRLSADELQRASGHGGIGTHPDGERLHTCTLLLYAAPYHALRRVLVEAELADAAQQPRVNPAESALRRVEVNSFEWRPCHQPIQHGATAARASSMQYGAKTADVAHRAASGSGAMSDDDDDARGDGLVLHFDSSSASASVPPSPSLPSTSADHGALDETPSAALAAAVDASATFTAVSNSVSHAQTLSTSLRDGCRLLSTTIPVMAGNISSQSEVATAAAAPRRVLLLRPTSADHAAAPATAPAPAAADAPPRAGRVLNIGSAAVPPVAPSPSLPASAAAPVAASGTSSNAAAASLPTNNVKSTGSSNAIGSSDCEDGRPHLLSFTWPPGMCGASADGAHDAGRVLYLDFSADASSCCTGTADRSVGRDGEDADGSSATAASALHVWMASCGALASQSTGPLQTPTLRRGTRAAAARGLAVLASCPSRQVCCLLCPLVALVQDGGGVAATDTDAAVVHAGPLTDVWVRAVSARACPTVRNYDTQDRTLPFVKPSPAHLVPMKQKGGGVCTRLPSDAEAQLPVQVLDFTPSLVSQLCCVVGSGSMSATRAAQWPSSHAPGLVWTATQVVPDCVVTKPRHVQQQAGAAPSSCPAVRKVRYVWLRSDPHQSDALHAFVCGGVVRAVSWVRGASGAATPVAAAAAAGAEAGPRGLRVVVSSVSPPSLSLCGGATGTATTIVLSEETVRAAALTDVSWRGADARAGVACAATASVLRARVAVTSAAVQHVLWSALVAKEVDVCGVRSGPDLERWEAEVAPCVSSAARVVALHWVTSGSGLLRRAPAPLASLLAEERRLLTSMLALGSILEKACEGSSPNDPAHAAPATVLAGSRALRFFQRSYAAAALSALTWQSRHAADLQFLREEGWCSLRLRDAEHALARSVLEWCGTPLQHRHRPSSPFLVDCDAGEDSDVSGGVCAAAVEWPAEDPLGTEAEASHADDGTALPAVLRGRVDVRVEHAAVMNALTVHLEWTTTDCAAAPAAAAPARQPRFSTSVEVPLLLLVFVVTPSAQDAAEDTASERSDAADVGAGPRVASAGCTARLYHATPFSWRLDTAAARAGRGATVRTAHSLTHALDLVARRPGAFAGFDVSAVTGLCEDDAVLKTGGSAGAAGGDGFAAGRKRGPPRGAGTAKRSTRTRRDSGTRTGRYGLRDGGDSDYSSNSDDAADDDADDADAAGRFAVDNGGQDAEGDSDTLVLNLGQRRGRQARPSAAAGRGGTRGGVGRRARSAVALTLLDTARVIPLVVLREDAAAGAPALLDVEVRVVEQLAAQLADVGDGAALTSSSPSVSSTEDVEDKSEGIKSETEASRVLCALLEHWTGFSALHTGAASALAALRVLHRAREVACITDLTGAAAAALGEGLTAPCVLVAFSALLRSVWGSLTTSPASCALAKLISLSAVRARLQDAASMAVAVEAAITECTRQERECRRLMLAAAAAAAGGAAAGGEVQEAEGGGSALALSSASSPPAKRGRPRGKRAAAVAATALQERHQLEQQADAAAQATWGPLRSHLGELVKLFAAAVLGRCGCFSSAGSSSGLEQNCACRLDAAADAEKRAALESIVRDLLCAAPAPRGTGRSLATDVTNACVVQLREVDTGATVKAAKRRRESTTQQVADALRVSAGVTLGIRGGHHSSVSAATADNNAATRAALTLALPLAQLLVSAKVATR